MKGLLGIATALILSALCHAVASHYWRPLLPWRTGAFDAASWYAPVSWLATGLLIIAVIALLGVALWALCNADTPTKRGVVATLGFVSIPYTASVLLYVLISGPIQAGAEGVPAPTAPAPLASPMELTVTSVADAEASLSRVRDHLRTTLTPAQLRLTADVEDVKARLRACGVSRSVDLNGNQRGQVLAAELAEAVSYKGAVEAAIAQNREVEFALESLVRRLKRGEIATGAGLPEGDSLRMNATLRLRRLDGQLAERAGQPKETELDALIDRELASTQAETPPVTAASR